MLYLNIQLIPLKKDPKHTQPAFGILMLMILVWLIINASKFLGYYNVYQYLYLLQIPVLLAILPCLNIYLSTIGDISGKSKVILPFVYFIPSILFLFLNVLEYFGMSHMQMEYFITSQSSISHYFNSSYGYAGWIFIFGNIVIAGAQIIYFAIVYHHTIKLLSSIPHIKEALLSQNDLLTLKRLSITVLLIVIVCVLMSLFVSSYNSLTGVIFNILLLLLISTIGYYGSKLNKLWSSAELKYKPTFAAQETTETSTDQRIIEKEKKQEIAIKQDDKVLISNFQNYMDMEKPYLNSDIGVLDIISKSHINQQQLSYILKELLNTNFYGIINQYRIKEAKELLKDPDKQDYSIERISRLVGYKSKTTFYKSFKKIVGTSPLEYRNNNRPKG